VASDEQPPEDVRPETGDDTAQPESDPSDDSLPRMIAAIGEQVGEIRDQLERLLGIQVDRLKLRLRSGLVWVLSGLLFAAICLVATIVAVLFLLQGMAGFFTALFGGNVWAGDLAAGGLVLLTILSAVAWIGRGQNKKELKRLKQKYEPGAEKGEKG